jgi:hypothetical protein
MGSSVDRLLSALGRKSEKEIAKAAERVLRHAAKHEGKAKG